MKAHRDQPPRDGLRRVREWLLALALAEIQLRDLLHRHLDHAVGELPRAHLTEPFAVKRGVIEPNVLKDALPDRRIECRAFMAAIGIPFRRNAK